MSLALFGISNDGLNLAVNLIILFLAVIWLALIYWTYADAKRRLEDPVLIATATVAALFPFVGTVVYTILRPPEYLVDVRERELEIRAAELRVRRLSEQACPNCEYPVEGSYLRCPSCRTRIKHPCPECERPLDPRWSMCPYCETPVRARRAAERGGRQAVPQAAAKARDAEPAQEARPAAAKPRPAAPGKPRPAAATSPKQRQQRPQAAPKRRQPSPR